MLGTGPLPGAALHVTAGPHCGEVFDLSSAHLTIGRDAASSVRLARDGMVSRRHAVLEWSSAGWRITDAGSTNGLHVNGVRTHSHVLRRGDRIQVGQTMLVAVDTAESGCVSTVGNAGAAGVLPQSNQGTRSEPMRIVGMGGHRGAADHCARGQALQDAGDLDGAIAAYREAFRLAPDLDAAHEGLLGVLVDRGIARAEADELGGAIQDIREVVSLNPGSAPAHLLLGQMLFNADSRSEARAEFEKAIGLDRELSEAYGNLGHLMVVENEPDRAVPVLQKAVALGTDDPITYVYLGIALSQSGLPREAIPVFRKAIQMDPNDAQSYGDLGLALWETGDTKEALRALRKAHELGDGKAMYRIGLIEAGAPGAWCGCGEYDLAAGNVDSAIRNAEIALRANDNNGRAHFLLARALAIKGVRMQEAVQHLREAVRLDPSNAEACHMLDEARKYASEKM